VTALANLPHRDGEVFRRPDGEPYERPSGDDDTSAGSVIKTAFKAAIENFHPHDCRHTWATWHYRKHRDLIALQRLGGWRRLSMVTRYAHQNSEGDRASIDAMPSLESCENVVNLNLKEA
jgi:integrase